MSAHTVRLLCESRSQKRQVLDVATGEIPFWWRGSDLQIQLALTDGGVFLLKEDITTLNVEVKALDAGPDDPVLMIKTIAGSACDALFSPATWAGGTRQLCTATFTDAEAALVPGRYRIIVRHEDAGGLKQTFLSAEIRVLEDQAESVSISAPPTPPEEYWTKDEADSRYALPGTDPTPLLIVGSGQSNMAASAFATYTITSDKVFFWNGTGWDSQGDAVVGAMAVVMAETLAAERGCDVYVVVSGQSSQAIAQWVGSGTSSTQYANLKTKVEAAIGSAELDALGITAASAFVWHQGESDTNNPAYFADWVELWEQLDGETWFSKATTPAILGQINGARYGGALLDSGPTYYAFSYHDIFRLGAILSPYVATADSAAADYLVDAVHFSADGMIEMGRRFASAFNSIPKISTTPAPELRQLNYSYFFGFEAGGSMPNSVSIGYRAAYVCTGDENVMLGTKAGQFATTNNESVMLGWGAGRNATTGSRQVSAGFGAGNYDTQVGSISIGYLSGPQIGDPSYIAAVSLGFQSKADAAWQVMLGGSSHTQVKTPAPRLTIAGIDIWTGTGTPEAAVTAPVGSLFLRSDGGAGTTMYVKESGAGNTGWVAK